MKSLLKFLSEDIGWQRLAIVAVLLGVFLIWYGRRKAKEPVYDTDQLSETAMWGYFLVLIGGWGVLMSYANPSDLFFVVMMVPALLALLAKARGYKSKGNTRPLPDWAAFGFSNALILALIGFGKTFVVEPMQIPSSSMRPGLIVGDFILISKFSYGVRLPFLGETIVPLGKPQRGDVVVFRFPLDTKLNYIKRLVGVPGDTVEYRNKQLTVNGQVVPTAPVGDYMYTDPPRDEIKAVRMKEEMGGVKYETLNVPQLPTLIPMQIQQFPQRDACQYDETGFVCKVPAGHYMMLGDNRDNSNDGRYWGFVPDQLLVGKAFLIWMNLGEFSRIGNRIE
ncbi:signal peptidase I [Chitinimonas lacunae]|uniref:Signal peptidase I n=1 Tax=Chitinimonas lacunae TaxID=1963018 RepID=A0ABV8MM44_9NEIS